MLNNYIIYDLLHILANYMSAKFGGGGLLNKCKLKTRTMSREQSTMSCVSLPLVNNALQKGASQFEHTATVQLDIVQLKCSVAHVFCRGYRHRAARVIEVLQSCKCRTFGIFILYVTWDI